MESDTGLAGWVAELPQRASSSPITVGICNRPSYTKPVTKPSFNIDNKSLQQHNTLSAIRKYAISPTSDIALVAHDVSINRYPRRTRVFVNKSQSYLKPNRVLPQTPNKPTESTKKSHRRKNVKLSSRNEDSQRDTSPYKDLKNVILLNNWDIESERSAARKLTRIEPIPFTGDLSESIYSDNIEYLITLASSTNRKSKNNNHKEKQNNRSNSTKARNKNVQNREILNMTPKVNVSPSITQQNLRDARSRLSVQGLQRCALSRSGRPITRNLQSMRSLKCNQQRQLLENREIKFHQIRNLEMQKRQQRKEKKSRIWGLRERLKDAENKRENMRKFLTIKKIRRIEKFGATLKDAKGLI